MYITYLHLLYICIILLSVYMFSGPQCKLVLELIVLSWVNKGHYYYYYYGHTTQDQTPKTRETRHRRKYRHVCFKAPTFSEDSREDMNRIVVGW